MKGGAAHRVGSGAERLRDCSTLTAILKRQAAAHMPLTAMCASPAVVLSAQGLLGGVAATVHPAFAHQVPRPRRIPSTRKEKLRIGREMAHAAVSRRTTVYLYTSVARTEGHAAKVWGLSIVQGLVSVAPCQTLSATLTRRRAAGWRIRGGPRGGGRERDHQPRARHRH
jgi:hypothetical protein